MRVPVVAAALIATLSAPAATWAADVETGRDIFRTRCVVCHNETAVRKVGPGLKGVFGREAKSGIGKLTEERLHQWLTDPKSVKPRTRMPRYLIMEDYDTRQSVIEFLKTL